MLVLICGPYGAGKSTIMSILASEYGYKTIRTFTTRPLRPGECEKENVSLTELQGMQEAGALLVTSKHSGHYYGTSRADVECAVSGTNVWMLDYAPDAVHRDFRDAEHVAVLVLPATFLQLIWQLLRSGRWARVWKAGSEYRRLLASDLSQYAVVIRIRFRRVGAAALKVRHVLRQPIRK
ncbi:MAG: hypothetical protein GY835_28055 [bacterium]|nr:hypothetical protein [bacterium]